MAYQGDGHLDAALDEEHAPPELVGGPQRDVGGEVVDDARHDGGRQRGALAGAQRDEQLRRVEDDGVDPRPLHNAACMLGPRRK